MTMIIPREIKKGGGYYTILQIIFSEMLKYHQQLFTEALLNWFPFTFLIKCLTDTIKALPRKRTNAILLL